MIEDDEAQQLALNLAGLHLGQPAKPRRQKVYTRKNRKKGPVGSTSGEQSHQPQRIVFQPEEERLLTSAFADRGRAGNDEVLITKFNIPITRRDVRLLLPDEWLNDELINFYMNLLQEHCERRYSEWAQSDTEPSSASPEDDAPQEGEDTEGAPRPPTQEQQQQRPLRCHFFNTFFYALLVKGGHARVARWTRNVDLFASSTSSSSSSSSSTAKEDEKDKKASSGVDLVVVPVHVHGAHWALATASPASRTLAYYDSLQHPNSACVAHLRAYLLEEEKKKKKLGVAKADVEDEGKGEDENDEREWKLANRVEECPRQMNGSDCGVFTCAFARCCALGRPVGRLHQRDMPRYRRLFALEILTGRLRPDLDVPAFAS